MRIHRSISLLALLLFFGLALGTAVAKSQTVDEYVHIVRGYTLYTTDDLKIQTQPPLSHWLIGSLLWTEPNLPDVTTLDSWASGDRPSIAYEWLWESGLDADRIIFLARLPVIWLALLGGALVMRWARALWGQRSQWMAALLFAASPNFIALAAVATTDLTVAVTYLAALYGMWQYGQALGNDQFPWRRWLLAGALLGLALGAKLTALLLLPLTFALSYTHWRREQPWLRPALRWAAALPLAGLVVWGLYRFDVGALPGWPFPVPGATYISNFIRVQTHISGGHQAYLLGDLSNDGWWHYFVVVFGVKTPLVTLLLLALAAGLLLWRRDWRRTAYLWGTAVALFGVASATRLNIGYRHILPILPLVWLLAAGAAAWLWRQRVGRPLLALALVWTLVAALRQHPHHLAYFNEWVGGSANGSRYLGDSNLDWGQDLKLLADFTQAQDGPVYVSYFGVPPLAAYGVTAVSLYDADAGPLPTLARANPAPGTYALSASHVQGLNLADPDWYDWFRRQTPVDRLGYSIFVYDVPERPSGGWIAQCAGLDPIDRETAVQLVGQPDARVVAFDCHNSWVFPDDGSPGWYILPKQETAWTLPLPGALRTVYVNRSVNPWFEVVYWSGETAVADWLAQQGQVVRAGDGQPLTPPLSVHPTLSFVGYTRQETTWITGWQVMAQTDAPLSIAGHLYVDGPPPQVVDGLGFQNVQWQPGDVILQFHRFDREGAYLQTGVYNFLTGELFPFDAAGQPAEMLRLLP